jgi:hypothetical protein
MKKVAIEWSDGRPSGSIEVVDGEIAEIAIAKGSGTASGARFNLETNGSCRLLVRLEKYNVKPGSGATIVTVRTQQNPFSFFLRDVSRKYPIYLPDLGVVVTEANDPRTFSCIADEICQRGAQTASQRMELEPEESYNRAAARVRPTSCPTWLGLSRDVRVFEFDFPKGFEGAIRPRLHNNIVLLPGWENQPVQYSFAFGRGVMCHHHNTRRLEDGVLPILHGTMRDEEIRYDITAFAALEKSPLNTKTVEGTHYLVAYSQGIGATFTDDQQKQLDKLKTPELNREEEPVLFMRAEAVNIGSVPRYAWIKSAVPAHAVESWRAPVWKFDGQRGFGVLENKDVFCVARLNGAPLPQPELGVLLSPGEHATFELRLPHRPISSEGATKMAEQSFDTRHAECRAFWKEKLAAGAQLQLPEQRIDEMARAGQLHLDLVAYGREPDGALAACTGKYTPIGTESAPIIQFMDSMGHHDWARRALMFFLEMQRPDGSLDAFFGYLVETGAILWTAGEHFRYTRDERWVRQIAPILQRSCDYLIAWRNRNKQKDLKGRGYGMIDGMVCDMPDPNRHFVLSGYAYLGLTRVAEMLAGVDPARSAELMREANEWKQDIRENLAEAMARSPVVPLRNGAWCVTAPAWAEGTGPVGIFADNVDWYSEERRAYYNRTGAHFFVRDSLLGPHYLVFQEILDLNEPAAHWLQEYHVDMFLKRNVASGQPYYSRHPWIHLKNGEVKAFLKAYYNTMAAQADRETYSFPEGIIRSVTGIEKDSPHKTHEEGWFLLETRWMLYMEVDQTLQFLPGIPRTWLRNGKTIKLDQVATYFGPASLTVESNVAEGTMRAKVECRFDRRPQTVKVRLPHPLRKSPTQVIGGTYDEKTEFVLIEPFNGSAEVTLKY